MSTLRLATATDAQAIHELHTRAVRQTCSSHYDVATIEGWLSGRTAAGYLPGIAAGSTFVALIESRVVGFCEAFESEVIAVFVDPSHAGRGIGSSLLQCAMDRAAAGGGTIRLESTLNAVGFYERRGFAKIRRSAVQRNGVDIPVVLMERCR